MLSRQHALAAFVLADRGGTIGGHDEDSAGMCWVLLRVGARREPGHGADGGRGVCRGGEYVRQDTALAFNPESNEVVFGARSGEAIWWETITAP